MKRNTYKNQPRSSRSPKLQDPFTALGMQSATQQPIWPTPLDGYQSITTQEQLKAEEAISELFDSFRSPDGLASPPAAPALQRHAHLTFLRKNLQPLPAPYVGFDSNRAWLLYWVLHGHDLLGSPWGSKAEDNPSEQYIDDRRNAVATLLSFQNKKTGGFGGGCNQISHLMASYAAISSLAIVGAPGHVETGQESPGAGWDDIDRIKMYEWLLSLKQPDGSFVVHHGGEVDVRASYCVLCISLLLGICTPELIDGMMDFISSCQTFEGGLAASAMLDPHTELMAGPTPALGEAHGGYAHCALASYLMLMRLASGKSTRHPLNLKACLRWAVSQQGIAIEGGAFRGRTNKLVDGCYGWFSGGGMFTVLDAALLLSQQRQLQPLGRGGAKKTDAPESDEWTNEDDEVPPIGDHFLYDRVSLQEYILVAAQVKTGGLRDKPGKRPDAYHTCYNLSGLSLAQHRLVPCEASMDAFKKIWKSAPVEQDAWRSHCYAATLAWRQEAAQDFVVGGDQNSIPPTHPVLNIVFPRAKAMMDHFYGQA